jgi:hypothetical protein
MGRKGRPESGLRGHFEDQLDCWYCAAELWPKDRSYKIFRHWFERRFHSMLIDLAEGPLLAEEI